MKMSVSQFIAEFFADSGITHVFSVVGGGAMYLNNSFAVNNRLKVIYNHHEQACAISAESYSRINCRTAAVCVTSGPGGTNALTGVLCAYQDNLPMIVISGQVRSDITVESTGLPLRQFGEQEYHIVRSVSPMTKYAVTVNKPEEIKYHLSKALHLANSGRRGPCWLDIPLDVQSAVIETDSLYGYTPEKKSEISEEIISDIAQRINSAQRPLIIAGSAIRTAECYDEFLKLTEKTNIPVICPTSICDILPPDNPNYFGMFGVFGGRTGNFLVQNSDLLIVLGARLSFKQIGFNYEKFSVNSVKIVVDADSSELRKPTVKIDLPVCADVKEVISRLSGYRLCCSDKKWIDYCNFLKNKFTGLQREFGENISAYQFAEKFMKKMPERTVTVLGNNCAAVSFLQNGISKKGQRLFGNVNCGTMGYDLPAAIGAAVSSGKEVFCVTGDGSFQMNIQELQTVVHYGLHVKIIVFNNFSYQAIVQTQTNFFGGTLAGCTKNSGISFPSFEKISSAYGFPYMKAEKSEDIDGCIEWIKSEKSYALLEIIQSHPDPISPKLSSRTVDGKLVSTPIDDLFPFLTEEEYEACGYSTFSDKLKR